MHIVFVHIGESDVVSVVDMQNGYKYILAIEDDLSGFV